MLHEVRKLQRRLHLESDSLVAYWDQCGCGVAPRHDALGVSLQFFMLELRPTCENCNTALPPGGFLGKDPASRKVKHRPVDVAAHQRFADGIRGIPPEKR